MKEALRQEINEGEVKVDDEILEIVAQVEGAESPEDEIEEKFDINNYRHGKLEEEFRWRKFKRKRTSN